MMINTYAKAYTEVLEILKYFPKEEYLKIPNEKIEFYKNNMDYNYIFTIDPSSDMSQLEISKEAKCILIILFRDYLATEKQKKILESILKQNQLEEERQLREKYNPDNLFSKKRDTKVKQEQDCYKKQANIIPYKETLLKKY